MDPSGAGHWASLLQIEMAHALSDIQHQTTTYSAALCLETRVYQAQQRCNHRPQATGGSIQERCANIITKATMNLLQNSPIKS